MLYLAPATLCRLAFTLFPVAAAPAPEGTTKPADPPKKDLSAWDRYRLSANRHAGVGDAVAHKALSFRGVRYRFGGTTRRGIDCSGLTQAIYGKWGLLLPRTSTEQFKKGTPVAKEQLEPGDLVFFHNTYRHGISHVGIYVGDGKFVHAANHRKGVIITPLAEPYYQHRYAGARRIVLEPAPSPWDTDAPPEPDGSAVAPAGR